MSKFDARKHLIIINESQRNKETERLLVDTGRVPAELFGLEEVTVRPQVSFGDEILPYPGNPRISMIVGFPDSCTYGLFQAAKWGQAKTNAKLEVKKATVRAQQEEAKQASQAAKKRCLAEAQTLRLTHLDQEEKQELEREPRETKKQVIKEDFRLKKEAQRKVIKEAEKEVEVSKVVLERATREAREAKLDQVQFDKQIKRQATVFGIGNEVHEQVRIKTREELLAERQIFLVRQTKGAQRIDWFKIEEKLAQGFTIVGEEFELYLLHKGLLITGHPDIFVLTPDLHLEVEEWKTSKNGHKEVAYENQAILYSLALEEIFGAQSKDYTIHVWNKSKYPLEGKKLLTKLKTGEVTVPINSDLTYTGRVNGRSKDIEKILDFTYQLFTAQIPCKPVTSGLCRDWCDYKVGCPLFKEQKQFVANFKVGG